MVRCSLVCNLWKTTGLQEAEAVYVIISEHERYSFTASTEDGGN